MSDSDFIPPAEPTSTRTKRRSTAGTSASKRAKTQVDPFADTKSTIQTILASPESFSLPSGDVEYRNLVVSIAQYAKSLEGSVAVAGGSNAKAAPPPKTPEQVSAEASRITNQINRGISKLMAVSVFCCEQHVLSWTPLQWKPSCKTGSAKYAFDGVCTDPRVFGKVLGLDMPPNFKTKKYTKEEFEVLVGSISKSVRWVAHLSLTNPILTELHV
jgi:hypothetical protein